MNRAGGGLFATLYALMFFTFLFGPLVIMVITAFNSSSFPRIVPWECFTTNWFGALLSNGRLMQGLMTSAVIGFAVVVIAVPLGLAGAIALSEVSPRLRATLYTVLIVPILIPGVVLGISTIVFWGALGRFFGASYGSLFYNGLFLTLCGQVTFIAAYAMLVFIARLQRFDPTLTEAALDLGATPGQAFAKILLPFLGPAIGSAAFLTLLASFENYNTTVFTILSGNTFTTALASKVRLGTDPSLSALAVIIISITLIGAIVHEAHARRRALLLSGKAGKSRAYTSPVLRLLLHPAGVFALLALFAALIIYAGSRYDSSACEAHVTEEKRARQLELMEEQRARTKALEQKATGETPSAGSGSAFGGAFSTVAPQAKPATQTQAPSPFGSAFAPGGLKPGGRTP